MKISEYPLPPPTPLRMHALSIRPTLQMKGSQQQGALVHFSLFREKRKKHKILQFSNYVDSSCINEQDMFENSEFRGFCNDSTALGEKKNDF